MRDTALTLFIHLFVLCRTFVTAVFNLLGFLTFNFILSIFFLFHFLMLTKGAVLMMIHPLVVSTAQDRNTCFVSSALFFYCFSSILLPIFYIINVFCCLVLVLSEILLFFYYYFMIPILQDSSSMPPLHTHIPYYFSRLLG